MLLRRLTLVLLAASALAEGSRSGFMTLDQMRAVMSSSQTRYVLAGSGDGAARPRDVANELWPSMEAPQAMKVVADRSGKKRVVERSCSGDAESQLEQAEALYRRGELERALAGYQRAAKLDPACPDAVRGGAECLLKLGRKADAVLAYRQAVALDPGDARLRFFLGSALFDSGMPDEAVEQLVECLVLRPRHEFALTMLRARAPQLGIVIHGDELQPKSLARVTEAGIVVAGAGGPWGDWATCKAFWLGDESHRRAVTGQARHGFSMSEELECLDVLVASYGRHVASGGGRDAELDRIDRIVREGYASELVTYEMGSRVVPWATLLLGDSEVVRLREFVKRYVVVRDGGAPGQSRASPG